MGQDIDVEVELDTGRRINQQWTKEKLAFYILSSDVDHPKFTNAAKEEWVTNYIMRARWDKQLLTEANHHLKRNTRPATEDIAAGDR